MIAILQTAQFFLGHPVYRFKQGNLSLKISRLKAVVIYFSFRMVPTARATSEDTPVKASESGSMRSENVAQNLLDPGPCQV